MSHYTSYAPDEKADQHFIGPAIARALGAMIGGIAIGSVLGAQFYTQSSPELLTAAAIGGAAAITLSVVNSSRR